MPHQLLSTVLCFPMILSGRERKPEICRRDVADPSKALVDFTLIDAVIAKVDEADGAQSCVDGGGHMLTIIRRAVEEGFEVNQRDIAVHNHLR